MLHTPVLLAATTIATFFAIAHMAVRSTPTSFRAISRLMLLTAFLMAGVDVAAGLAVMAAVLLARRLALAPVPATVPAWISDQR